MASPRALSFIWIATLASPVWAITVRESRVAAAVSEQSCTVPRSVSVFQATDRQAFVWFVARQVRGGDHLPVEWVDPAGGCRRRPITADRVELTPLVRDVCEQGQILAQAWQLEIFTEVPEEPVYVDANDPALRRLLLLLVDNAVKYTPAGGHITVSVGRDPAGATVTVRDTGIGIPDSALPHVFERFYRADESRNRDAGGAGLGLSIAQWIAERHHASLEAESVVGQGSAFRVRFPRS